MEENKNYSVKILSDKPLTTEQLNQIAQILSRILPQETISPSEMLDEDGVLKYEFTKRQAEDLKNELRSIGIECSIVEPTVSEDKEIEKEKTETKQDEQKNTCPNCGKEVPFEAKFCLHCGSKVSFDKEKSAETKKCPFCAEEIQSGAKTCKWCRKNLTRRELNFDNLLNRMNYVLVAIAILSFFLPFAKFKIPIVGSQSFSGFSVVWQSLSHPKPEDGGKTKKEESIGTIKDMTKKSYDSESLPIYYNFIPIGWICGVLAYLSLIVVATGISFKKYLLTLISSMSACVFSICFMFSFLLMDSLIHYSNTKELEGEPFAFLALLFTEKVKIQPSIAIYLLILTTFLISCFCWLRNEKNIVKVVTKIKKLGRSMLKESSEDSI